MFSVKDLVRQGAATFVLAAAVFQPIPAHADGEFPFGLEMTLDVARQGELAIDCRVQPGPLPQGRFDSRTIQVDQENGRAGFGPEGLREGLRDEAVRDPFRQRQHGDHAIGPRRQGQGQARTSAWGCRPVSSKNSHWLNHFRRRAATER